MTIMKIDPGVLLFGLRINMKEPWAGLFIGKYGIVILGEGEGK